MQLQCLNEADVVNHIKTKEAATGRPGLCFITRTKGVMKTVKLTVENDMLIADGRELIDMSQVEILPIN